MGCYIRKFGINENIIMGGSVANEQMLLEGYEWYEGEIPERSDSRFLKWDGERVYEDTARRIEEELVRIRQIRNEKLSATDWVVSRCAELGIEIPQEWKDYRQALRDITKNYTAGQDFDMTWPTEPMVTF